jgi:hypothetical protein
MIRASNYFAIGLRGADIDNGEFVFLKCSSCGTYALFDRETELLYTKPGDLTGVATPLDTRVAVRGVLPRRHVSRRTEQRLRCDYEE